jgi:hypothetical protein
VAIIEVGTERKEGRQLRMSTTINIGEVPVMMLAVAVAMVACVQAWNSATHRLALRLSFLLGSLFWVLAAFLVFWACLVTKSAILSAP